VKELPCLQFVLAAVFSVASAVAGPQITTTTLPPGTIGTAYSATLNATGGSPPYAWAQVGGLLPSGLTLSANGTIAGTPGIFVASPFTYNFSVTVHDSLGNEAPVQMLSISVARAVAILTLSLPGGSVGTTYSQTLASTGGAGAPYIWTVVSGTLPPGLTLNPATGAIVGIPSTAAGSPFSFSVTAGDTAGRVSAAQGLSIVIAPFITPTTTTLTSAVKPATYGQAVRLTATVNPAAATGKVTFYDGVGILGTMPVSGGRAVLSTILLGPAGNALQAYFSGLPAYLPSKSAILPETVNTVAANGFGAPFAYTAVAPVNGGPYRVVVADFNGDGIADFATPGGVALGDGNGTFQAFIPTAPFFPAVVAAGDFNGDGKTDLATPSLGILPGNGDGTFQTPIGYPAGSGTVVAVADFDGDGNADLATSGGVLLGNGDGTFKTLMAWPVAGAGGYSGITAGDFNGDGKADVFVVSVYNGASFVDDYKGVVFAGNGDGTFHVIATGIDFGGSIPTVLAAADLNADGKTDLVFGLDSLTIYLGNGDGTFRPDAIYAGGFTAVSVGDFNGDGELDLAATDPGGNAVGVLLGNGDGTFWSPLLWSVGGSPQALAVADFNGDGRADILSELALTPASLYNQFTILAGTASNQPAPSILPGGVVPLYSKATTIQPGEWVSIYGSNLASVPVTSNGPFPTSLGGTSVTIDGKAAYLLFVSPGQIDLQAPDDTAIGATVPVEVTTGAGTGTSTVTLGQFGPSFSLLGDTEHVAGIILKADGSYDILGPTGSSSGFPTVAAKAGDVVELFGVGFGPTTPFVPSGQLLPVSATPITANYPVQLTIGGAVVPSTPAYLSEEGLYQINVTIPAGLGTGDLPLTATVGGIQTPAGVVISLQ
jgi:uncharacterized protein (TIGR03437 family)